MAKDKVFKNRLTLELRNEGAETEFQNFIHKQKLIYNKYFSAFLLVMNIGDVILQNVLYERSKAKPVANHEIYLYTSYLLVCFSLLIFILGFGITFRKFQIFIAYVNYTLTLFPFTNIRETLLGLAIADERIFALLRTLEILIRTTSVVMLLVTFPHGLYMNLTFLGFVCFYISLIQEYYSIFFYFLALVIDTIVSYFFTKGIKQFFFIQIQSNEQMNWYFNLFEHMHSGFISFKNNYQIKIINSSLLEVLYKNKDIERLLTNSNNNINTIINYERKKFISNKIPFIIEDDNPIYTKSKTEDSVIDVETIKNSSEKVLTILLEGIYKEVKEINNISQHSIRKTDFNLQKYLNEINKLYIENEKNEKFILIGYKDFEVDVEISNEDEEQLTQKKKDIRNFEIFFRCRNNPSEIDEEKEYEIIFNDITNIKKNEEKNAELKYKTMFLSKVAHEFKNPLICISELVSKFNEDYSQHLNNRSDLEIQESFRVLKKITHFTDYLLILMRDLDFFSQLQIQQELPPAISETVDLNEIFETCSQMAEILLLKFNKTFSVKFILENNLSNRVILYTDGIKLKQVITNLISNAIKSTNLGVIKLKAEHVLNENNENMVRFEVSDTGVGITEHQLQNLIQPFKQASGSDLKYGSGLGLYVVNQILKQLKTKLSIQSKVNEGTKMSFTLNCQIQDDIEESILTINISENSNNLAITSLDRTHMPIFKDEEESLSDSVGIRLKNPQPLSSTSLLLKPEILRELEPGKEYNQEFSYYIFVDDEIFTLKSSIRILKKTAERVNRKVEVIEAEDGIECLYLIYKLIKRGFRISAIISDELMNHMNGTLSAEVLKRIKNLNTYDIPFFLLTAYPDIKNKFIDYLLIKPLNSKDAEFILNYNKNMR